ncbi:hypothetical protein [Bacillus cereus]|uniref:hypothetical protein n=1 Tax=Bacillus cereus TaxID=1396 RepID=UPI002D79D9D9|nr:hypothetical protein [Bacillus cereus]
MEEFPSMTMKSDKYGWPRGVFPFSSAELHFVDGTKVTLAGGILKALHDGILKGFTIVTDSTNNITYNMANVIKIEWIKY